MRMAQPAKGERALALTGSAGGVMGMEDQESRRRRSSASGMLSGGGLVGESAGSGRSVFPSASSSGGCMSEWWSCWGRSSCQPSS